MKFRLEIELGNDAMQTFDDIACALIGVKADMLELADVPCMPSPGNYEGPVMDDNGNTVGKWSVEPQPVPKSADENDSCCDGDSFHRSNCYKARRA